VRTTDAFANLVLPAEIDRARLSARDAGLATELTYGMLRMQGTLDWIISVYSTRSPDRIEPPVLDALRLGTYQLLYTDIPEHAAVAETVGVVQGPVGFVNAVLRQIAREKGSIPWPQPGGDLASYIHICHSHPGWIVRLWLDELGPHDTEALCRANNVFPGVGVRVNTSRVSPEDLRTRFRDAGLDVQPGRYAPDALLVRGGGRPQSWPGFGEGHFAVQDEASVLAADATDATGTLADLCAGPGGKTARLARDGALVVASDVHLERARLVRENIGRLGGLVVVVQADGRVPPVRRSVDGVLVDAPCSGLGVLRRRPEARWRVRPDDVVRSAELQAELVRAGFELLRPGGTLVYAVCTVTSAETTNVVEGFVDEEPGAELMTVHPEIPRPHGRRTPYLQLLPHVHGTDGMFIAQIRRTM
jgi:16S rRNA (cytosine967-C5)-methyltransferase